MSTRFLPATLMRTPRRRLCAALFALAFVLIPTITRAAIPESERAALVALYDSTHGDSWFYKTGWLGAPGTECDWSGVTCDEQRGHVLALRLNENNLAGRIPPEIGNFPYLTVLDLNINRLSGEIPPEIAKLGYLETFFAHSNFLSGSIPPQLGQLSRLQGLDLGYNDLTGGIPPELGKLTNLRTLYLFSNQLSGPIPWELGGLASVENLALHDNQLSGKIPRSLAALPKVGYFSLAHNLLVGKIPKEFANLTPHVYSLDLSYNQLTGKIPDGLAAGYFLNLSYNRLSGILPQTLRNTPAFAIDLRANQLSGPIRPFRSVSFLWLSQNSFTGSLPASLGDLPSLYALGLDGNLLTGEIPATFANLRLSPGSLDLRWNALWSQDPALIAFLNSLQAGGVDFRATQTVPPEGLGVGSPTGTSLAVSWSPILYQADAGGYRVLVATQPQGPYTLAGIAPSKAIGWYQVTGLQRGTTYYFTVRSSTLAHPPYNSNDLTSPPSAVVSGTTLPW